MPSAHRLPQQVIIERRSNRLARGLRKLGVTPDSLLTVFVADSEHMDAKVAELAAQKLGARHVSVSVPLDDWDAEQSARSLRTDDATVIVACERGGRALRAAGVRGLILSNCEWAQLWWRLIEARESPDILPSEGSHEDTSGAGSSSRRGECDLVVAGHA